MSNSMQKFDIAELERYLGSIQYTIPTKSILDLQYKVEEWISMNDCGAIIYGESRVGKTRAIRYISLHLKESFNRFLIISLDVLICRYSPLFRAFPALFISEEPHKSFYYPLCFRSQK